VVGRHHALVESVSEYVVMDTEEARLARGSLIAAIEGPPMRGMGRRRPLPGRPHVPAAGREERRAQALGREEAARRLVHVLAD
jgi:hypothetical protein